MLDANECAWSVLALGVRGLRLGCAWSELKEYLVAITPDFLTLKVSWTIQPQGVALNERAI